MGVVNYIICEKKKEYFELGRGMWNESMDDLSERSIREDLKDVMYEGSTRGSLNRTANRIIQWCAERDWSAYVVPDTADRMPDLDEYIETGSLYEESFHMSRDEIQVKLHKVVEEFNQELGADSIQLTVTFVEEDEEFSIEEDEFVDRTVEWDHIVHVGYDGKFAGYMKRKHK